MSQSAPEGKASFPSGGVLSASLFQEYSPIAHAPLLASLEQSTLYNALNWSLGIDDDTYGTVANATVSPTHSLPTIGIMSREAPGPTRGRETATYCCPMSQDPSDSCLLGGRVTLAQSIEESLCDVVVSP